MMKYFSMSQMITEYTHALVLSDVQSSTDIRADTCPAFRLVMGDTAVAETEAEDPDPDATIHPEADMLVVYATLPGTPHYILLCLCFCLAWAIQQSM